MPYGLATLTGLLLFLSFPPFSMLPLAFLALVPLMSALRRAPAIWAFKLGLVAGFVFFVLLLHWIVFNPAVEPWVKPLLYLGTVLIGLYLGLFLALPASLTGWLAHNTRIPVWLSFPVFLTLSDYLRTQGFLGFPWGSLGYSQVGWLPALQMASVGGIYLVTFWSALVNGLVAWSLQLFFKDNASPSEKRAGQLAARLGLLALVLALPPLSGHFMLKSIEKKISLAPAIDVALVQGNIEQGMRWDREFQEYNWRTYRELTLNLSSPKPGLAVWPETAMPFYLRYEPYFLSGMLSLVDSSGIPVLTGVPDVKAGPYSEGRLYYNSAFLFLPGRGFAGEYAKSHLVPFGERFPLKEKIPGLRNVSFGEGEWTPGPDTVLLRADGIVFSCLVCFESIFPKIARRQASRGARLFVNITNDGWFGRSGAARQHAEMAVLRAVEQRRAVARCANSGVSMFIMPSGRILQPTPLYERAVIVQRLPLMDERTAYNRVGDLFILLLAVASLAAAALAIMGKTR